MNTAPGRKTLYQILGVSADASTAAIQAAYEERSGAAQHDESLRVALKEAYGVLSNQQRRAVYDASLRENSTSRAAEPSQKAGSGWLTRPRLLLILVLLIAAGAWWWARHAARPSKSASAAPVSSRSVSNAEVPQRSTPSAAPAFPGLIGA